MPWKIANTDAIFSDCLNFMFFCVPPHDSDTANVSSDKAIASTMSVKNPICYFLGKGNIFVAIEVYAPNGYGKIGISSL